MNRFKLTRSLAVAVIGLTCLAARADYPGYSGVYPHIGYYNNENECGTGAVVPWAGSLWVITYAPHCPDGSSDKLYEIKPDKSVIVHSESIGGTPANRMIHRESNQLFIGPYAIDNKGNVRVIDYKTMPGRHTGNARHLTDPEAKILYATMEEGFYEVDVNTLAVKELFPDGNHISQEGNKGYGPGNDLLPGVHGKGFYSGQGVMVYSNNGEGCQEALTDPFIEAGVLAEWDGKSKDWTVVRRCQFTEVTGPGGIEGNKNPATDPIWALGWDAKSVILACRDAKTGWSFYRLPKASHSYDGAHGWNTEWPRIRNVGSTVAPDYLMTMHGMFWRFPSTFTALNAKGIRPRGAYLKVIGDFSGYNDGLVFGCDVTAKSEFLNTRKFKGGIAGPGQSNSNLWFTTSDRPDHLGATTAEGQVWANEDVKKGVPSEPFLFAGWNKRMAWLKNDGDKEVKFTLQTDTNGKGSWKTIKTFRVGAGESVAYSFPTNQKGEWVRVISDSDTKATAGFAYTGTNNYEQADRALMAGFARTSSSERYGGLMWPLSDNRRALGILANKTDKNGKTSDVGYYELDGNMNLVAKRDVPTEYYIKDRMAILKQPFTIDRGSVLIVDDRGRRWRLPVANREMASMTESGESRVCREVATERDMFSCMGTFFELPAENADGFAKIRPVASSDIAINDYATYRGLFLITGIDDLKSDNPHIIHSTDGKAAVWAGDIDDLWSFGKPVGEGGPWIDAQVKTGEVSDPYLIGFYDKRSLDIESDSQVVVSIEADPSGNGDWMEYKSVTIRPGEKYSFDFPDDFQARWIRFRSDANAKVTTYLKYQ